MTNPELPSQKSEYSPKVQNLLDTSLTLRAIGFMILSLVVIFLAVIWGSASQEAKMTLGDSAGECNVTGINLHGTMLTYIPAGLFDEEDMITEDVVASEDVVYAIDQAEWDDDVKAILLEVDSYGGLPVAGEEIANALKRATKPTVAFIRSGGASAAYWAATGADRIFASKNSDVGSIGATMSYLDNSERNRQEGISYVDLSTGKFKDTGSPDKPLTAEERALLMRDLKIVYENFIEAVSTNRDIPADEVRAIADGSTVMGARAVELKLVDEIGGQLEAEEYLAEQIGEEVATCWY
jgi:protease-4